MMVCYLICQILIVCLIKYQIIVIFFNSQYPSSYRIFVLLLISLKLNFILKCTHTKHSPPKVSIYILLNMGIFLFLKQYMFVCCSIWTQYVCYIVTTIKNYHTNFLSETLNIKTFIKNFHFEIMLLWW